MLHIFNPEHDIALASGLSNFTAPHAGRQLHHDLGFLPALWAAPDDVVLVDDVELATSSFQRFARSVRKHQIGSLPVANPHFAGWKPGVCDRQTTTPLPAPQAIDPWGWDAALCARLRRRGVADELLPQPQRLDAIRQLSHRRTSARLLPQLRHLPGTVGESFECRSIEDIEALLTRFPRLVLKAPWSSSGRGLRFIDVSDDPSASPLTTPPLSGWLQRLLATQGSVMAEPYYPKVRDFGMEFHCDADGTVRYLGLSLFHTTNGAYTGNILATESAKRKILSRYLSTDLLDSVQAEICRLLSPVLAGSYYGPLGIDMMIVSSFIPPPSSLLPYPSSLILPPFSLHPCVEINLRRTMGHVALHLSPSDDGVLRVMRIHYHQNTYHLKIEQL